MSEPLIPTDVLNAVSLRTGRRESIEGVHKVSGGCINDCFRLETSAGLFFVKTQVGGRYPFMFEKEADGLNRLRATHAINVARPLAWHPVQADRHPGALTSQKDWLLLDWIEPSTPGSEFWEHFGSRLASMHRSTSDGFGLSTDNYIGSLPQNNNKCDHWAEFFCERHLRPQIKLAADAGLADASIIHAFEHFCKAAPSLFPDESPALLHGDLWSGNFISGPAGEPWLVDPAVYFGHREADLAMSLLFGGFSTPFYDAYQVAWPLESGFANRVDYYNLYPLLVHLNLFGSTYAGQIKSILKEFQAN